MKGRLISNTGPLIAFSIINHLDVLHHLYSTIVIPEAVHREILEGGANNIGLTNYQKVEWIKITPLSNPIDPLLKTILGAGEAAVIWLAQELHFNFVLIGEIKARKTARNVYGLNVVGSARVLVEAKRHKLLNNVGDALQAMRDGGYWIDDSIFEIALKEAGE